jgi:hypothetical protein
MMSPRLDVAVVDEGRPGGGRRERDAIDQDVVADEQRLLHGGGGDLEVLEDEGHDEEADGEHGADGGERLERVGLVSPIAPGRGFGPSLKYCPAGRAHCAWSGHFATFVQVWVTRASLALPLIGEGG